MTKIAVFDIDGTVYREAMSFIVAEELLKRYDFPAEAAELAKATSIYRSRGSTEAYWTYNKTILDVFKRILVNITPTQLSEVITELLETKHDYCYAYTTQLISKLKAEERILVAISGSIANIVDPFSKSLGFDYVVASALEIVDGKFTGERATETKMGKDVILRNLVDEHGLTLEDSIGIGDTHRDISFLSVTEHPIAFNPNVALYDEAIENRWDIVLERKNMIFELIAKGQEYVVRSAHPIFDDNNQEHLR
jgi:HAD superfamily phosphoserine phosphatase-like hydrolase